MARRAPGRMTRASWAIAAARSRDQMHTRCMWAASNHPSLNGSFSIEAWRQPTRSPPGRARACVEHRRPTGSIAHTRAPSCSAAYTANRPVPQPTSSSRRGVPRAASVRSASCLPLSTARSQPVVVAGDRVEVRVSHRRARAAGSPRSGSGSSIVSKSRGTTVLRELGAGLVADLAREVSGREMRQREHRDLGVVTDARRPGARWCDRSGGRGRPRPRERWPRGSAGQRPPPPRSSPGMVACHPRTPPAGPGGPGRAPDPRSTSTPLAARHRLAALQLSERGALGNPQATGLVQVEPARALVLDSAYPRLGRSWEVGNASIRKPSCPIQSAGSSSTSSRSYGTRPITGCSVCISSRRGRPARTAAAAPRGRAGRRS